MLALIVEPSESDATLCVKSLSPQGIETAWMPNAETAIQYCKEHVIDILISRVILDDTSGYEMVAEITKDQPIAVLMISKYSSFGRFADSTGTCPSCWNHLREMNWRRGSPQC
jgi:DNA-binding NtrC family response regulator